MAGGRIRGLTIEIEGNTTKLASALKDVDKNAAAASRTLKDINGLLKLDPGNTELLGQKYWTLASAIDETQERLRILREAQEQANEAIESGAMSYEQYDALQREIIETEQNLESLEKEFGSLGGIAQSTVEKIGGAIEKFGNGAQKLGGAMENVGGKMTQIGDTISNTVGRKVLDTGKDMVTKFIEVDKTMALTNKTMGNTAAEADLLDKAMQNAAKNSTFGMSDAANASLNFARAGLDAEQAAAAMAPAMNLAAGEGGNLDTVSAGLVATINGFHGSFDEAGHYADVFAGACNNSALDVDSLSQAMSVAAPVFSAAGKDVEDAALYMGVMANNGLEAGVAANSLKTGLARLMSPAKDGATAMAKLGLMTEDGQMAFLNLDGSMKDSVEVQKILHDSFANLSEQEQISAASAIFGKNQMSAWLALINTAPEDVAALSSEIEHSSGLTDEMAEAMMDGFGGSVEQLKSSLDVLMTSMGQLIAEYITPLIEKAQGLVDWFMQLDDGTKNAIVKAGLLVAAAGPLLSVGGKIVSGCGTLVGGLGKVASAVGGGISSLGKIGGAASQASGGLGELSGAASSVSGPASKAGGAIGGLSKNAAGFVALGAGIALAAAGMYVLVKAAIEIGNAGPKAQLAMVGLVAAIAGLAAGAAALGGALTAGAVGFLAFGAAVTLVGVGMLALGEGVKLACEGFAVLLDAVGGLVDKFPLIVEHAGNAALGIAQMGLAITGLMLVLTPAVLEIAAFDLANIGLIATMGLITAELGLATIALGLLDAALVLLAASIGLVDVALAALNLTITAWGEATSGAIDLVTDSLSNSFDTIWGILKKIHDKFKEIWDKVVELVKGAIEKIKKKMDFKWSLPKLKMPHVKIDGHFSLNPPSAPKFSIDWYKKAMENGMILNSPTIFGAAGNRLLAGGEAGPEAVVGVESLRGMIQEAVAGVVGGSVGPFTIPVYIGSSKVDTVVADAINRANYKSGGR